MTRRNGTTKRSTLLATLGASLLLAQSEAQALGWRPNGPGALRTLPVSGKQVAIHPFKRGGGDPFAGAQGFSLFERGALSFSEAVKQTLRGDLHPLVEMRGAETNVGLGLRTGGHTYDYRFYVGGVPLCGFQVRAHELSDQGALVLGTLPELDTYEPTPDGEWPDLAATLAKLGEGVGVATGAQRVSSSAQSKCYYVANGKLLPVWKVALDADGLPYEALADQYEVVSLQRGFFDAADGTAKAYEFNKVTGEPKDFPLKALADDGTLASDWFKTVLPSTYTPAKEPTHTYNYEMSDPRFDEVQAFVHVNAHFDYMKSLGFEWYGPQPLELKLHVAPAGRPNNALFIPGSSVDGSKPSISIHDGDGVDLQYLISDGDVVSHEFGHHVIYKTLRSTDGESLVLHEGLADFFTFSRTGDACLGESICPKGSTACVLEAQCLRTAANTLVYNDVLWNQWAGPKYRLGHLHGQLVSGLLWDLRKDGAVPAADLAQLVLKAVGYFKEDSGFRDFSLSLLTADKEAFGSKYGAKIREILTARGMTEYIQDVPAEGPIPALEGGGSAAQQNAGTTTTTTGKEKKEKKGDENPLKCGTIDYDGGARGGWMLLLLAVPLLLAAGPVPARSLVPSRKRRSRRE